MSLVFRTVTVVVSVAFAAVQPPTAMAAQTGGTPLFVGAEPASASAPRQMPPRNEVALRRRARIDPAALALAEASVRAGIPASLTLNLFDDALFEGIVERTAPTFSGGYALSGQIADDPTGTVTLVVNGETVAGTVRTAVGIYRIRSVGDGVGSIGVVSIEEVDESKIPFDCTVDRAGRAESQQGANLRR